MVLCGVVRCACGQLGMASEREIQQLEHYRHSCKYRSYSLTPHTHIDIARALSHKNAVPRTHSRARTLERSSTKPAYRYHIATIHGECTDPRSHTQRPRRIIRARLAAPELAPRTHNTHCGPLRACAHSLSLICPVPSLPSSDTLPRPPSVAPPSQARLCSPAQPPGSSRACRCGHCAWRGATRVQRRSPKTCVPPTALLPPTCDAPLST